MQNADVAKRRRGKKNRRRKVLSRTRFNHKQREARLTRKERSAAAARSCSLTSLCLLVACAACVCMHPVRSCGRCVLGFACACARCVRVHAPGAFVCMRPVLVACAACSLTAFYVYLQMPPKGIAPASIVPAAIVPAAIVPTAIVQAAAGAEVEAGAGAEAEAGAGADPIAALTAGMGQLTFTDATRAERMAMYDRTSTIINPIMSQIHNMVANANVTRIDPEIACHLIVKEIQLRHYYTQRPASNNVRAYNAWEQARNQVLP